MKISPYRTIVILACLLTTYLLLQHSSGTTRISIRQPLANFPTQLGPWRMIGSNTSTREIVEMLGVDDYIDYNYRAPEGMIVNFYVAFYESVGTTGSYHSPKNCLPGNGWGIDTVETVTLPAPGQKDKVLVSEMLLKNQNDSLVVVYWYQNRGRIIYSEYWEKIYLVLDALLKKRRDGAFVRITIATENNTLAQSREQAHIFAALALGKLYQFLPGS